MYSFKKKYHNDPSAGKVAKFEINFNNLIFFITGFAVGMISLIPFINVNHYYFFKTLQLTFFLLLGYAYLSSLKKNILFSKNTTKKRNYVFHLAVLFLTGLATVYWIYNRQALLMALSCSMAFIFPFCLNISWLFFKHIPKKEFEIWVPQKRTNNSISLFLDSLFIKLRVAKKLNSIEWEYDVYAPRYTRLGNFFSRFLKNQQQNENDAIEDTDNSDNLYAWEFFIIDAYGLKIRRLDPNLTLDENRIKQHSVITVKRLAEQAKLLTFSNRSLHESHKQ